MLKSILTTCFVLLLAGCATQTTLVWDKRGTTPDDFNKVNYTCEQAASTAAPPAAGRTFDMFNMPTSYDLNADNREHLYQSCMKANGWQMVPRGAPRL